MGQPIVVDQISLQSQVLMELYEKWALDIIGPIDPLSKGKIYINLHWLCYKVGGSKSLNMRKYTSSS